MSNSVVRPPHVTESAQALLDGRPVFVRASRRNGCCGGTAAVPVAEAGAPEMLDGVDYFNVSGIEIYVERGLLGAGKSCTIDTDGFSRWRRLVVLDVDLAPAVR